MTNKEFFTIVANGKGTYSYKNDNGNTEYNEAVVADTVVVEFAKSQLEKLSAKNDSRNEKARAKKSAENAPYIEGILNILADGNPHTCGEIAKALDTNTSKISALVGKMDNVTKSTVKVDKKKAVAYTLAN